MALYEPIIVSCGVAFDAFAVAVCCGIRIKKRFFIFALLTGILFGWFQFFMPLLGWWAGKGFGTIIEPFDYWFAFILLSVVGGKMIWDALHHDDAVEPPFASGNFPIIAMSTAALATSLDALGVGVSYGVLSSSIGLTAVMMGIFTLFFSFTGVIIGSVFGHLFERKIEIVGGAIIILIGCKILVEHLFQG